MRKISGLTGAILWAYAGVSSLFVHARGRLRGFYESVRAYFTMPPEITWSRQAPKIYVDAFVYVMKPDKTREFFSFLRLKKSWF